MKELKVTMKNDCVECESCKLDTGGLVFTCEAICTDVIEPICKTCDHKKSIYRSVSQVHETKCNVLGDKCDIIGCYHYKLKEKEQWQKELEACVTFQRQATDNVSDGFVHHALSDIVNALACLNKLVGDLYEQK